MKQFQFLAKQGQHHQIARLLTENFGKPRVSRYNGPRGRGVLLALDLPKGVSKRAVDRLLHAKQAIGAVSRRNRFRVIKFDYWLGDIAVKIGCNVPFVLAKDGKLRKAILRYICTCECCGGYYEIEYIKRRRSIVH